MNLPISFEFFPPKSPEARINFLQTINELKAFNPEYMSVTTGAFGTSQEGTKETVADVQQINVATCPHITCVGTTREKMKNLLLGYKQQGINRVLALRGDLPEGETQGEFSYATELVEFIQEQFGDYFKILVAAYPEKHPAAENFYTYFAKFMAKANMGADSAITQIFFNVDAYDYFLNECAKNQIDIPIIPGIMPITDYQKLKRITSLCEAELPRWLSTRLDSFGDDVEGLNEFGLEVISKFCQDLIKLGAPGFHFYTMNQSNPTARIIESLS